MNRCEHIWVSNSGEGGDPIFTIKRQLSPKATMHVTCRVCNARTWYTEEQWDILTDTEEDV